MARQIIDRLAHKLRIGLHRFYYPSDHQRELNLVRGLIGVFFLALPQLLRTHADLGAPVAVGRNLISVFKIPQKKLKYSSAAARSGCLFGKEKMVTFIPRRDIAVLGLAYLVLAATGIPAFAVTAEVARKCSALMAKQFPPRESGNPAAGSTKGSGRDQQAFFNKCVANGGKIDDSNAK